MAALIIAIFPQNSSRGNWEEQQDRTDPNSRFELARKPAWLLAFRQFGLPKWKHDFESFSLRPLRYISIFCSAQISRETHLPHHSSLIIITKTPLSVNRFSSVPLHAGMHRAFLFCIITKPASAARMSLADTGFCF